MKVALTIAGSDCSGGAGIQADLKTFLMHGVYGMSVVTALTAQNTTGVYGVVEPEPAFLASQLDCVFQDIFPDAVKIGMMPSAQAVQVTAEKLRRYRPAHIVIDPVMVSTSGRWLMSDFRWRRCSRPTCRRRKRSLDIPSPAAPTRKRWRRSCPSATAAPSCSRVGTG